VLWFSFVLFGLWLARRPLLERRWQLGLLAGGAAAVAVMAGVSALGESVGAIASDPHLAALFDGRSHTVGFPSMVGAAGSSAVVIGGCLLLARSFPRPLRPLAGAGQLSLTLYLLHLVPLVLWLDDRPWTVAEYGDHPSPAAFLFPLGVFAAFVVAAALWRSRFERGPAESVLRWVAAWRPPRRGGQTSGRAIWSHSGRRVVPRPQPVGTPASPSPAGSISARARAGLRDQTTCCRGVSSTRSSKTSGRL